MDKAQALQEFWSSFGLLAFDELSAYDESISLPNNYITYEVQTANFGDPIALTASLWYRSTSWAAISKKVDEIANYIGYGGRILDLGDDSYLWIKLGTPFSQRMAVEDDSIRRIVLNIEVDFLTIS